MGVVMFGVFTIAAPFWEEPLFSGMVANRLVAKFGPMFGAILTSGLFALSHVPVYGWSSKLVSLMFAGLTYTALRLLTGNIGVAIAAHLIVNVLTVLPKWVLAWYHFRHGALSQS